MEIKLLPIERLNELNEIYDMSRYENFQATRQSNLENCREICVVAEHEGRFVGELSMMTQNANIPVAVIPNKRIYLFGLRILPEFQRRGIGTALLEYAVRLCARRGIFEFTIGVEQDNEIARKMYKKMGFTELLENCSEMQYGRMCRYDLLLLKIR
ncbi:MAG: GNAT family N-acetyltransferase [Firmicutes bacterium]|nr:GNAT family N-acetyltransferase [[Eubacterium] siraeum]MCM1488844.1 GNAT family N-acetyltransferase [Bacillota bacterium]